MNRLSTITLTIALLSICASATPVLAKAGSVPMCDFTGSSETQATEDFIDRLQLRAKQGISVNVTDGCFKVEYVNGKGMYMTEYYHPGTELRAD